MDDEPDPSPLILISDRQDLPVDAAELARLARATLIAEGAGSSELSVSFVTAQEIAELHERYMGEPGPTDVLAFPQHDDELEPGEDEIAGPPARLNGDGPELRHRLIGDVVVCPAVAREQRPADPDAEMRLLLVHGILHLLGYDHEADADRLEMWRRQQIHSGVWP